MSKSLLINCGVSNTQSISVEQSLGDVGPKATLEVLYSEGNVPTVLQNRMDATINLPYGSRIVGRMVSPQYTATPAPNGDYRVRVDVRSEQNLMARAAFSRTIRYHTVKSEEFARIVERYNPEKSEHILRLRISEDQFGRGGWTAHMITRSLIDFMSDNITDVVITLPDYWIKDYYVPFGYPIFQSINELFNMFNPMVEFHDGVLFIMDRSNTSFAKSEITVNGGTQITFSEPYQEPPVYVRVEGGYGEHYDSAEETNIATDRNSEWTKKWIKPTVFGIQFDAGLSYGDPIVDFRIQPEITAVEDKREVGNDVHVEPESTDPRLYSVKVEVDFYLRNLYGERGEKIQDAVFEWKNVGAWPTVPYVTFGTDGKCNYTELQALLNEYRISGIVYTNLVGDLTTDEARAANDIYSLEITNYAWRYTDSKFEKPRQDSSNWYGFPKEQDLPLGFHRSNDPNNAHTMKITGGWGITEKSIIAGETADNPGSIEFERRFIPVGKMSLKGTTYSEQIYNTTEYAWAFLTETDWGSLLEGVPVYEWETEYAIMMTSNGAWSMIVPEDGEDANDGLYRGYRAVPVLDVKHKASPVSGYVQPRDPANEYKQIDILSLLTDASLLLDERCINKTSTRSLSRINFESYTEKEVEEGYDVRTGIRETKKKSRRVASPPPQEKIELRKQQIYWTNAHNSYAGLYNPPLKVSTEMIDWDDLLQATLVLKDRAERGRFQYTLRIPIFLPFALGTRLIISGQVGPNGHAIMPNTVISNPRIISYRAYQNADGGSAYTEIEVEGDVVDGD